MIPSSHPCRVTYCRQGHPGLSTIPESSSILKAKRTNAGAPWAKDARASKFSAVEPFILCDDFTVPFPLMPNSTRQSWSVVQSPLPSPR